MMISVSGVFIIFLFEADSDEHLGHKNRSYHSLAVLVQFASGLGETA